MGQSSSEAVASRMGLTLGYYARRARVGRWITGATLVAGGALTAGVALASDPDQSGTTLRAIGIGAGAALAATGAILWALPSPMERLSRHASELETQGVTTMERVARVEGRWSEAATRERRGRRLAGVLFLLVGATFGALTVMEFAQDTANVPMAAVDGVAAVVSLGSGVMLLATPGMVEQSWRGSQMGRETAMREAGWGSPWVTLAGGGGLVHWRVRF